MESLITWILVLGLVFYNLYRISVLVFTWSRRNNPDLDKIDRETDYEEAKAAMVGVMLYDGLVMVGSVVALWWKS